MRSEGHNGGRRKRRHSSRRPSGPGSGRRRGGRRKASRSAPSSSFAPPPLPSRAAIEVREEPVQRPVWRGYLFGFPAVFLLILFGGSHNPLALGLALILPGAATIARPRFKSLGPWVDLPALAFLVLLLSAFMPTWMTGMAEWRQTSAEVFGFQAGSLHSVQGRISFETWLLVFAGFVWLYSAASWEVNFTGRRRLMLWVSLALCGFAGFAIWGNQANFRYPGAADATAFSFFPNRNQTANFLALGGVAAFGFAMEGLRSRKLAHFVGLAATCLCLFALILSVSRAGILLYFLGLLIWFVFRIRRTKVSVFAKVGFPLVLLLFSVFLTSNESSSLRIRSLLSAPGEMRSEFRPLVYRDTVDMIGAAPLIGHGIGNFAAVFPQYREASRNDHRVVHPESDLLWLGSEGGLLALGIFACFLAGFFMACRRTGRGASDMHRVTCLTAVILFLLHALVDVPAHRAGTVYFAVLFAGLALPPRSEAKALFRHALVPRLAGVAMVAVGLLWFVGGLSGLSTYSETAVRNHEERVEEAVGIADYASAERALRSWVDIRPLDWRAHFRLGQVELASTGNIEEAAVHFRRARFFEPVLGVVPLKEGFAWLSVDRGRAVSAWRAALARELNNPKQAFEGMVRASLDDPEMRRRMIELSRMETRFRLWLLAYLDGEALMEEIRRERERETDLSHLAPSDRVRLVEIWINRGDVEAAEAFLEAHGDELPRGWWLKSLAYKNLARFEDAVMAIRKGLPAEVIPETETGGFQVERAHRIFMTGNRNLASGTALLRHYVDEGDYEKALAVANRLLEAKDPPPYAAYWRAETLYRMGDLIESWYAFEWYVKNVR